MPATIVETNTKKFKRKDIDPITLDIIENAMMNARYEMDAVVFRTAMSPGIREQNDMFPMIANLEGKMVVGQFGSFIHGFKEAYDGTIEEGDLFLTTDPYACNGAISHINDWLLLRPIFKDGRLIAYAAMFGHMTDIGGKVPGSLPTDAAQIFEEGIQIPPVKIYRRGELNTEILEMILRNCRLPEWNRSDFNAVVAALRLAERRIFEMVERFGVNPFISAMQEMLDRNKRAMGSILNMVIPESKQHFVDYIDDDGMGSIELTRTCSGTTPLFHEVTHTIVFKQLRCTATMPNQNKYLALIVDGEISRLEQQAIFRFTRLTVHTNSEQHLPVQIHLTNSVSIYISSPNIALGIQSHTMGSDIITLSPSA